MLTTLPNSATLAANTRPVLTDAEREVIDTMRSAQSNPRLTVMVLQYVGDAWCMYTTTTRKRLKS